MGDRLLGSIRLSMSVTKKSAPHTDTPLLSALRQIHLRTHRSSACRTHDDVVGTGRVLGLDNVFTVIGYGDHSITLSQVASAIISAQIEGLADPDEKLAGRRRAVSRAA